MSTDQKFDGHLLPFRLEWTPHVTGDFCVLVDAEHRDLAYLGESFGDMLAYMKTANASIWHSGNKRHAPFQHPILSRPEYLVEDRHPCERTPAIYHVAFECLVLGRETDWIDAEILEQLRFYGVCGADLKPLPLQARRWREWRVMEDAAAVAAGIRPDLRLDLERLRAA